jgi:hypothetical protein
MIFQVKSEMLWQRQAPTHYLSCKKNLNTQTTVFLNQYTDFNKPISFWTTAIIPTPVLEEPRKSQYAQHTLVATIWKI